jgi:hypothetical protein
LAIISFAILAGLVGVAIPPAFGFLLSLAFALATICAIAYNGQLFEHLIAEHARAERLGRQLSQEGRPLDEFPRDSRGLAPGMAILRLLSSVLAVLALLAVLSGRPNDPLSALVLTFGLLAPTGLLAIPVVMSALSVRFLHSTNTEAEQAVAVQNEARALIERLAETRDPAQTGVGPERSAEAGMAIAAHVLDLGAQILREHPPTRGKTIAFQINLAGLQAALEPGPPQGRQYWITWALAALAKLPPAWAAALVAGVGAQTDAIAVVALASVVVGAVPVNLRIKLRISA